MNKATTFFLLLLLGLVTSQGVSQNTRFGNFTIEDGLPQSQVYDIVQDDIGYLWLATQGGGIANFDGSTFTVFNEDNGLSSNHVNSLYCRSDTLFIGSRKGLSLRVNDHFINFNAPAINAFYSFGNGQYLATERGVYKFSKTRGLEKVPILPEIDKNGVNAIYADGHFFWLATNNGLWKLSELSETAIEKTKVRANYFTDIVSYGNTLFAATFSDGIMVLNVKNKAEILLIREPRRINSMSLHNENELWVATENDGITIIDTETYDELKRFGTKDGLSVPHVRKVMSDTNSGIWIATAGGGFYKYFQNNFNHYDNDSGLKGNRTYAVHKAKNGIWISSSEAGLTKLDSLGIHHIPQIGALANVKIKTIASDAEGTIWAGTEGRGILYRETKQIDSIVTTHTDLIRVQRDTLTKTIVENHFINTDTGFPSDWIRKIIVGKEAVWAATNSNGIVKFNFYADKDSLVIRNVFNGENGMADRAIKTMATDLKGNIWYTTKNGDLGYITDNTVTHFPLVLNRPADIGTLLFHRNYVFIGTSGQGIWYAEVNENLDFKKLKYAKKLSSGSINQLIFDNQGYLWAGTERGVDKIELNQANEIVDVYHFGKNDGFLAMETCLNAVDKDENGNIWFGGMYGLTQYSPGENDRTVEKPEIRFKGLEIDYRQIDSIPMNEWARSNTILQLNPAQNQLAFRFKTVDIDHPDEVQYRYRLNEAQWSPWSSEERQNLMGLAYGPHTFSIQSRNYRWLESEPLRFGFHIESPLHRKPWFQWAMMVLAALIVTGIALLYIRRIKAKNRNEKERLQVENHLLTLEQKALRLQMNPHFIFNVLNGIKAMNGQKPQKMNETINSFAALLRDTLNNSREDSISLSQEIKTLEHYVAVEQLMAAKPFEHSIIANTEPDAEEILIPPMLVQPFVENAIRHGILKGPRKGKLSVRFYTENNFLHCTITDNGLGIFQSQKAKTNTDHQSMALTVTRERLESISGKNALGITEVKNDDQCAVGTQVALKIPLRTDY